MINDSKGALFPLDTALLHHQANNVQRRGGDFVPNHIRPSMLCGNFADTLRNVVCQALQTRRSSATGASFAEDPGFRVGDFAATLKREIAHTTLTAPEIPPPPPVQSGGASSNRPVTK